LFGSTVAWLLLDALIVSLYAFTGSGCRAYAAVQARFRWAPADPRSGSLLALVQQQ